ncbi:hypothetical protein NCCP2716_26160 [Sporosarcina sp. NCCP-2716]|uniref:hypothetical protein n=1 Tax=Sporosarcina sp. NCCP-2716 TaxID=2943679 RepID=UPI00203F5AB8|nr:hypothetical protein [Sporosarcina sp. NCCP-2716]GKV70118.1 hypothetical protein NCCP2716_26160 [Sporosarcina sp. NCCP-2716]
MTKNLLLLLAGILFAWFGISFFTKNFDGNHLMTLLIGVFLGYIVKKEEKNA